MKHAVFLLGLALLLGACSTSTTSSVVTYDAHGREVSSTTTSETTNDTAAKAREIGREVKEDVISGYEWTRDKTVEGYHWVKEKAEASHKTAPKQ